MIEHFPKDKTPRPIQTEAIERIEQAFVQESRDVFVLDAPTGCGKSAIAMTVLEYFETGFITSPQKMLVDQYAKDYENLAVVKGQNNYSCASFPFSEKASHTSRTCEYANALDSDLHKETCSNYIPQRDLFWCADLSVTTLDFLYRARCPQDIGGQSHRRILVIDESHNLEESLIKMGRVEISDKQCGQAGLSMQHFHDIRNEDVVRERLCTFKQSVGEQKFSNPNDKVAFDRKVSAIEDALDSKEWMYWRKDPYFVICPLDATKQAASLFARADKLLLMSATIGNHKQFLKGLGLSSTAAHFKANSTVPVEQREVSYQRVGNMSSSYYSQTLPKMIDACGQVLKHHSNQKGLVLCASYKLQKDLAEGLKAEFNERIYTHNSDDREYVLERFYKTDAPAVLFGVAMTEGLDLKDDLARFLIIPKVPYPNIGDPYVKARKEADRTWYDRQTALSIVQGAGRVVRSDDDHASIYVFDSSFEGFLKSNESLFPAWFLNAVTITINGKKRPYIVR